MVKKIVKTILVSIKGFFGMFGLFFFILFSISKTDNGERAICFLWNQLTVKNGFLIPVVMIIFMFVLGYIFENVFKTTNRRLIPMDAERKIENKYESTGFDETCPICHRFVYEEYCSHCGQRLKCK